MNNVKQIAVEYLWKVFEGIVHLFLTSVFVFSIIFLLWIFSNITRI